MQGMRKEVEGRGSVMAVLLFVLVRFRLGGMHDAVRMLGRGSPKVGTDEAGTVKLLY
jgi:hypothetical protein